GPIPSRTWRPSRPTPTPASPSCSSTRSAVTWRGSPRSSGRRWSRPSPADRLRPSTFRLDHPRFGGAGAEKSRLAERLGVPTREVAGPLVLGEVAADDGTRRVGPVLGVEVPDHGCTGEARRRQVLPVG